MIGYFVLTVSSDGVDIHQVTKEELEADLQQEVEDYDGVPPTAYLKAIPCGDVMEWAGELYNAGARTVPDSLSIIIKGEIVTPRARQVVTRYEID